MTIICADCGRAIDGAPHLCVRTRPVLHHISRLVEDDPMARYDGTRGDLVPGYADSSDGQADAADQRKADAR